jgi:DNA (cytosine-5)-methyltransferase 1
MEQIRGVKELREADVLRGRTGEFVRPRFMVWENVPGAFGSGKQKGADFAAVIEELIKIAEPDAAVRVLPPSDGWTKSGCYYDCDGRWSIAWRVHDAQFWGVPQRRKRIALVADFGGLSAPEVLFERKGLSRDLEPGRAKREGVATTTGSGATGAIGVDLYNQTTTRNVAKSLNSAATDADHIPCVIHEALCIEMTSTRNTIVEDGISPALTARMGTGGNQVNAVMGFPLGFKAESPKTYNECATTMCNGTRPGFCAGVIEPMNIVRRLTPLECERLQGYPDGWTDIGEWVDSKGKRHREADSPRYKALGNSIALPFWKVLAKRISAQYDRDITMGSLFDGIGGFPLVFEQVNGKGTARWASEIEEFPMAVTKIRFGEE